MDTSATSKRKLLPFVVDSPYHIQLVFIFTFGYIWYSAMSDDYLTIPATPEEDHAVNQANWWKAIYACVLFLCAWAYLEPYHLDFFAPMQRFWRVVSMLAVIYFCLVLVLLNHRPKYGRFLLGYLDPRLN